VRVRARAKGLGAPRAFRAGQCRSPRFFVMADCFRRKEKGVAAQELVRLNVQPLHNMCERDDSQNGRRLWTPR
jgi:hypothetical protein